MKPGVIAALLFAAIVAAVAFWRMRPPAPAAAVTTTAAPAPARSAASVTAAAAPEPLPPPPAPSEPIVAEGVAAAVEGLVGHEGMASLRVDDFPHRLAATVDNLARERASPALWPALPTPGRFTVRAGAGGRTVVDPDNGQRYAPFVQLVERVDLARAVAVYHRMLPLLQPAYEALGYPGKSFDARLVAVVEHLLAAPEPAGPVAVHLPPFHGAVQPSRPWLLYEFDDPELEELSAGQKLFVRMGPVNERRLKQRLRALHALLVAR